MRLAVLSDVHSNLEALDAVLADAAADRVVVLGDLIGYGADPQAVVERLVAERATLLAGNHDMALTERFDLSWFNAAAAEAVLWTRGHIEQDVYETLWGLSPILEEGDRTFVHGSMRDPAGEYLVDASGAHASFEAGDFSCGFFGHTHVPFAFELSGREVLSLRPADKDRLELQGGVRYLLNPGSVGQPRDRDPRASYLVLEDNVVSWHRVEYDIGAAQKKIRTAGLPRILADRLSAGR